MSLLPSNLVLVWMAHGLEQAINLSTAARRQDKEGFHSNQQWTCRVATRISIWKLNQSAITNLRGMGKESDVQCSAGGAADL
jgi:hypothetical protein